MTSEEFRNILLAECKRFQVHLIYLDFYYAAPNKSRVTLGIKCELGTREYSATGWNRMSEDKAKEIIKNTVANWLP